MLKILSDSWKISHQEAAGNIILSANDILVTPTIPYYFSQLIRSTKIETCRKQADSMMSRL